MKALISSLVVLFIISFCSNLFSQSGWVKQNSFTIQPLKGLYFMNDNTGWTVGDSGVICKTTNAGTNWVKSTYIEGGTLVSVYFWDENLGLIGGYIDTVSNGFIIRTTDGGASWSKRIFWYVPYGIASLGGDTAWICYRQGVQLSFDRGNHWNFGSAFGGNNLVLHSIHFINNLTGWTCGRVFGDLAYVYKSTDGGVHWFNQFNTLRRDLFYSVYPADEQTVFVTSIRGEIYKTSNGGDTWEPTLSGVSAPLYGVNFPDIVTGYTCGGNNIIMKTTTSGSAWNFQLLPPEVKPGTAFYSVSFRSANLGWAVGDNGTIIKTSNGGEPIGINPIANIVPDNYELYQNYPNPFNPVTTIEFDIMKPSFARLTVYDITGEEITTLANQYLNTGKYKVSFSASAVSSGTYYYRLTAGEFTETKKLVLLK